MIDRLSETTTVKLLNAWKAKKGIDTDYRAAKELGTSHGTPGNWRHGRSHAAPALAARMAKDIDMDVMQVLAAIEADRAHNADDRRVWQRLGRGAFVALVLGVSPVSPLRAAQAPAPLAQHVESQQIHPLCEIISSCGAGSAALDLALDQDLPPNRSPSETELAA